MKRRRDVIKTLILSCIYGRKDVLFLKGKTNSSFGFTATGSCFTRISHHHCLPAIYPVINFTR